MASLFFVIVLILVIGLYAALHPKELKEKHSRNDAVLSYLSLAWGILFIALIIYAIILSGDPLGIQLNHPFTWILIVFIIVSVALLVTLLVGYIKSRKGSND